MNNVNKKPPTIWTEEKPEMMTDKLSLTPSDWLTNNSEDLRNNLPLDYKLEIVLIELFSSNH
jgi:hypothetical protein